MSGMTHVTIIAASMHASNSALADHAGTTYDQPHAINRGHAPSQEASVMKSQAGKRSSRRAFLKQAGTAVIAAPMFVAHLESKPPSRRVRHASFGAEGMAGADIGSLTSHRDLQLVCVAEV